MRRAALVLGLVALAGCRREGGGVARAEAPLEAGWEVHDRAAGGRVLLARVLPAAPDSDEARLLEVKLASGTSPFDGMIFEDARLIPGGVAGITRAHALILSSAPAEALDQGAVAPLDVSRDGRFLAYASGEPPELEIVRFDLQTRAREPVTRGMAPAWSPALSPDGARAAFVSGRTGWPAVYVARIGEAPVQVTNLAPARDAEGKLVLDPFPTGPDAPRFDGEELVFEEHTLDLRRAP